METAIARGTFFRTDLDRLFIFDCFFDAVLQPRVVFRIFFDLGPLFAFIWLFDADFCVLDTFNVVFDEHLELLVDFRFVLAGELLVNFRLFGDTDWQLQVNFEEDLEGLNDLRFLFIAEFELGLQPRVLGPLAGFPFLFAAQFELFVFFRSLLNAVLQPRVNCNFSEVALRTFCFELDLEQRDDFGPVFGAGLGLRVTFLVRYFNMLTTFSQVVLDRELVDDRTSEQ